MPDLSQPPASAGPTLDLSQDAIELTAALVDIASVSGEETVITDAIEAALRAYPSLEVLRDRNVVIARTHLGRAQRVVLAGHTDTVPVAGNLPSRRDGERLHGLGSSDMKSGDAVFLRIAHLAGTGALVLAYDLTWVFYDCEEIEDARNGLGRIAREHPQWLAGDLAVLGEGTDGAVEGGCQGTLRVVLTTAGVRAHSARSWLGRNAIHLLSPALSRLAEYRAREVEVEGLRYREGLNAVAVSGGVSGNVIPDAAALTVNFRFAPDRGPEQAVAFVREFFAGFDLQVADLAAAARPGLDAPLAQALVAATGTSPRAKLGWTDVARFGALGIAAVNFGPGDPALAHKPEESVLLSKITEAEATLVRFLSGESAR